MLRSVLAVILALALVAGAAAQDVSRFARAIDGLSSPPKAEELAALGASDPNAYVYFLQDFLSSKGIYAGPADGMLTKPTIGAIVRYCREAGVEATCSRGPLLPESIAAVSGAVAAALAPVEAAVAEEPVAPAANVPVAAPAEGPVAAVAEPAPVAAEPVAAAGPALPEGWRFSENGGTPIGIAAEIVSAGAAEAVIRLSGTATGDGYFNIVLGTNGAPTDATWVTEVSARRESVAGTAGEMWLQTGLMGEKGYLGELFAGVPIGDAAEAEAFTGSGVPAAGTGWLVPYVQLRVKAGDVVDTTVALADPRIGAQ